MSWNKTSEVEPPRERVIEVTWGAAWNYTDYYQRSNSKYGSTETTRRSWYYTGMVSLAIWYPKNVSSIDEGHWADPAKGILIPDFTFWREYDNPFCEEGALTSTTPPRALSESFKGDARLRLYDEIKNKLKTNIKLYKGYITKDFLENKTPLPSQERALKIYENQLEKVIEDHKKAYDPYELHPNIHGKVGD